LGGGGHICDAAGIMLESNCCGWSVEGAADAGGKHDQDEGADSQPQGATQRTQAA